MTATITGAATDARLLENAIERHGLPAILERCVIAAHELSAQSGVSFGEATETVIELLIGEQREWEAQRREDAEMPLVNGHPWYDCVCIEWCVQGRDRCDRNGREMHTHNEVCPVHPEAPVTR